MSYTTSVEVKNHLGITDTSYDAVISALVSDIDVEINSTLNIDGFGLTDEDTAVSELVQEKDVYAYGMGERFVLKNPNVLEILEINGTAYTGTLGLTGDYFIRDSQVYIKDRSNYVTNNDFGLFEITYTHGYEEVPDDIQLLAKLMASVKFRQDYKGYIKADGTFSYSDVSSYQLADESISFGGVNDLSQEVAEKYNASDEAEIKRILSRYKKVYVV